MKTFFDRKLSLSLFPSFSLYRAIATNKLMKFNKNLLSLLFHLLHILTFFPDIFILSLVEVKNYVFKELRQNSSWNENSFTNEIIAISCLVLRLRSHSFVRIFDAKNKRCFIILKTLFEKNKTSKRKTTAMPTNQNEGICKVVCKEKEVNFVYGVNDVYTLRLFQ